MTPLTAHWLGRMPYTQALAAQRAHRARVKAGEDDEAVWLLEHEPVITTGRRKVDSLPSAEVLAQTGTELVHTERGGLATWHGPGQLVAYVIVDAWSRSLGARGLVCAVEDGVIAYLAQLGIAAHRRPGFPGVWVQRDKICAVGMHFSGGVSMHGIALNLQPDLSGFSLIEPCGVTDGGTTSVDVLLGSAPTPQEAASALGEALIQAIEAKTHKKGTGVAPKTIDVSDCQR